MIKSIVNLNKSYIIINIICFYLNLNKAYKYQYIELFIIEKIFLFNIYKLYLDLNINK